MSKRRPDEPGPAASAPASLPPLMPAARPARGRLALGAAAVLAAVLLVHWTGLQAGAISFDDCEYLTENPLVRAPSATSAWRFMREMLEPSTVHGYYQPLTMISLMIDCALGGRPEHLLPFHRTSLILHLANTLLVMLLLYRLFGDALAAGLVGLLFGVHPLTVETLVWVGERKTVLAAFFALLSVAAYLRYVRTRQWWAYAASLGAFVLALLAKPTVTPLPLCLFLLDYWPLKRPMLTRRVIVEKLPYFAIAAVSAIITFESQRRTAVTVLPGEAHSMPAFYVICHNIVFYLWKMVLPIRLSSHYPYPWPVDMSSPAVAAGVSGTFVLVGVLLVSWRWTRALLAGWLFFFVAVLPTLGVIGFTNVIASDKYVYWPSFGLMMIVAWALSHLHERAPGSKRRPVTIGVVGVGIVAAAALGVGTRRYLQDWRTTETLFLRMTRLSPGQAGPLYYLGAEYIKQGRGREAVPLLRVAVEAAPRYSAAALALGDALQQSGDLPGAAAVYRRAIALKPGYFEAHNNLGNVLLMLKDSAGARESYEQALKFAPGRGSARYRLTAEAHYNLANVLVGQNQAATAEEHYQQAIAIAPDLAEAHQRLGDLWWSLGRFAQATGEYEQVLRAHPDYWQLAFVLAEFYARTTDPQCRRPARAVELAEQTAALAGRRNDARRLTLAQVCLSRVYRLVGRPEDAAAAGRKAIELAQTTGDAAFVQQMQTQLARP